MNINTIVTQFETQTLPKSLWTHPAHLAVAFKKIDQYKNVTTAHPILRQNIINYNVSVGTENSNNSGYHETLTLFWLHVVYEFYVLHNLQNLDEIFYKFLTTKYAQPSFTAVFYSKELLFSKNARKLWTEPDLLPITELQSMMSIDL